MPAQSLGLYVVSTFSSAAYGGNTAGVVLDATENGLSTEDMMRISAELNLPETSFVQKLSPEDTFEEGAEFGLRWFTPTYTEEVLCGHGTLAAAAVLFRVAGNPYSKLRFQTLRGELVAKRKGVKIGLELPAYPPNQVAAADFQEWIKATVGEEQEVLDVCYTALPYPTLVIRLPDSMDRASFESICPDAASVPRGGPLVEAVSITKKGTEYADYKSRYFDARVGMSEHYVTGSLHTMLAPYWAKLLGKTNLHCRQGSTRGGDLEIEVRDDGHIDEYGEAVLVYNGSVTLGPTISIQCTGCEQLFEHRSLTTTTCPCIMEAA